MSNSTSRRTPALIEGGEYVRQSFIQIDVDKAVEDAIDTDGISHFLDRYDGSELDLPSGAIAYGTN